MDEVVGGMEGAFDDRVRRFYAWLRAAKDLASDCSDTSGDDVTTLEDKLDVSRNLNKQFQFSRI